MLQSGIERSSLWPLFVGVLIGSAVVSGGARGEAPEFTPSGESTQGQRVDIAAGAIDTKQFFRFLADFSGVAVSVDGGSSAQLEKPITMVASIQGADDEIVLNLLAANGWRGTKTTLPGGKEVLRMSYGDRPPAAPTGGRATEYGAQRASSSTAGTSGRRREPIASPKTSRSKSRSHVPGGPIFQLRGDGLFAVEEGARSLVERDVAPDSWATVIVPLAHMDPNDAIVTLRSVISPTGQVAEDLVATEVRGARKVILAGKASLVDYALCLLQALDDATTRERVSAIVKVQHDDVERLAQYINRLFALACTPKGRGPVNVTADARTRTLVVEAVDPADLERVRIFVQELGATPKPPQKKTHIYQLKHIEATDVSSKLAELFEESGSVVVPHKESNSLLIQAQPEILEAMTTILRQLDAPSAKAGPEG